MLLGFLWGMGLAQCPTSMKKPPLGKLPPVEKLPQGQVEKGCVFVTTYHLPQAFPQCPQPPLQGLLPIPPLQRPRQAPLYLNINKGRTAEIKDWQLNCR